MSQSPKEAVANVEFSNALLQDGMNGGHKNALGQHETAAALNLYSQKTEPSNVFKQKQPSVTNDAIGSGLGIIDNSTNTVRYKYQRGNTQQDYLRKNVSKNELENSGNGPAAGKLFRKSTRHSGNQEI